MPDSTINPQRRQFLLDYAFQGEFLPFRWLSTLAVET